MHHLYANVKWFSTNITPYVSDVDSILIAFVDLTHF